MAFSLDELIGPGWAIWVKNPLAINRRIDPTQGSARIRCKNDKRYLLSAGWNGHGRAERQHRRDTASLADAHLVKEEGRNMSVKRVLLPVGGNGNLESLSDTAFHVAERLSAQVMGLFVQPRGLVIPYFDVTGMEETSTLIETVQQSKREAAARAQATFEASVGRFPHVESVFRSIVGDVEASFIEYSRLADLSVIMPPDPLEDGFWGSPYWLDVQNATLFRSGRPVLFVPPRAIRPSFDTVVIAWKESLEAARAIAAAQPFMTLARQVHLLTITDEGDATTSLRQAEEYLSLHYDEVRGEIITGEPHEVGKLLLAQAYRLGALLVMGAYSHWRWRERLLGGVTDYVLREASIPVLMMH